MQNVNEHARIGKKLKKSGSGLKCRWASMDGPSILVVTLRKRRPKTTLETGFGLK